VIHQPSDADVWQELRQHFASGHSVCNGPTDADGSPYSPESESLGGESDRCYDIAVPVSHWCDQCKAWWAICNGQEHTSDRRRLLMAAAAVDVAFRESANEGVPMKPSLAFAIGMLRGHTKGVQS
jgi:hypothetical protein